MTRTPDLKTLGCMLCSEALGQPWQVEGANTFFRCDRCDLIQKPVGDWPSRPQERDHYALHQNDSADPRYRAFLDRCFAPLCLKLRPGSTGMDFGCGPGPTLERMAEERGFSVTNWDPVFAHTPAALTRTYDFLVATEVLEHLHRPAVTLAEMHRLVRPGGWLAVMTRVYSDHLEWKRWNYWRDPTHVCFYTSCTLAWIAEQRNYLSETPHPDVRLWQKPG